MGCVSLSRVSYPNWGLGFIRGLSSSSSSLMAMAGRFLERRNITHPVVANLVYPAVLGTGQHIMHQVLMDLTMQLLHHSPDPEAE